MEVGLLKEVKDNDYRVVWFHQESIAWFRDGSCVRVQKGAGVGSGFSDEGTRWPVQQSSKALLRST